jgi:hypothetical protein
MLPGVRSRLEHNKGMSEMTEGGDPVCWLSRVCDECGAMRERPAPAPCDRCGAVPGAQQSDVPPAPAPRSGRDRDAKGRPRNARPRDGLGRPLPYGTPAVERAPEGIRRSAAETLTEAQRLLDAAMPFHAHEVLEDMWKTAPADERSLWRALAQLAVGLTHAARGNSRGAAALLQRAAEGLAPYEKHAPHDVNAGALLRWLKERGAPVGRPPALRTPSSGT